MRKNKKSCSISEFCRNNNFRTLEFYKMLSRHPELARKMKANSAGERVLDEEAMMTVRAILRMYLPALCAAVVLTKGLGGICNG